MFRNSYSQDCALSYNGLARVLQYLFNKKATLLQAKPHDAVISLNKQLIMSS